MVSFTYDPNHIWRDGPATAPHHPIKHEIRAYHSQIQQALMGLVAEAGDLDLPNLLIRYTVTGGTADAIVAEPNLPVPGPGMALLSIQIAQTNTGPVTINGKPWLTNIGNQFVAGGIKAGGIYLFLDNGDHYRAITDQDVSALVAAAEAAVAEAESARIAAEAAASNAAAIVGRAPSMAQLIDTNPVSYPVMEVLGFYLAGDWAGARGWGGCRYRWHADEPKANHNGGVIIDPDHSVAPGDTGWWDAENSGTGCWVLERQKEINARVFGFRADCQIAEVDYDPNVHSGGFVAQYPHKIHEPAGVLGTDYHDDSRAFKALADWVPSNTTVYWPGGTYFTTNQSEIPIPPGVSGETATVFSWMNFRNKSNILHLGDYGQTLFFAYQDITHHSLYMVRNFNSRGIVFRGISMVMQGIGHPNSETHPSVEPPITFVQTRFGFMENLWGDDPDSDQHCSDCVIEDAKLLRLNHPEGAYPGESFGGLVGSGKLVLMYNIGRYDAPVSGRPPASIRKNLVRRCGIRRIDLLTESQSRGVWDWQAEDCFAADIYATRTGGVRPAIMRGTHWNARAIMERIVVWCEHDWKTGGGHLAPFHLTDNGGDYISPDIRTRDVIVYRREGAGLQFNACENADVDIRVYVDPDHTPVSTSPSIGGINMRVHSAYDGSTSFRGRIAGARVKAVIEGGVGAVIEAAEDCHFDLRVKNTIGPGVEIAALGERSTITGFAKGAATVGLAHSGTGAAWRTAGQRMIREFTAEGNGGRGLSYSGGGQWIYDRTRAIDNTAEGYRSSNYLQPILFKDAYSRGNSAHMSSDSSAPPIVSVGSGAVLIGAVSSY